MANGWHRRPRRLTPAVQARVKQYNSTAYRHAGQAATRLVASGHAHCWRPTCRRAIPATAKRGRDWHLGHDDNDRRIIRGPECARCNLSAAGRKGAAIVNRRTTGRAQSRVW